VVNRLGGSDKFSIFTKRVAGVGIPVDIREIAAGDGHPYPMTGFKNMTGVHQADSEFIYFSWR